MSPKHQLHDASRHGPNGQSPFEISAFNGSEYFSGNAGVSARSVPQGVLKPQTALEVQRMVEWANTHRVSLNVFSSASPFRKTGLQGSAGGFVLDLNQMRRVLKVDRKDAVAIIEPGVDFAGLDAQLAQHGLRSFRPLRPRAGKSVIASYLDREPYPQWTAQWDVVDPFGSAEMVFGNGEVFRSGTASLPGTMEEHWTNGLRYLNAAGPVGSDFLRVLQGAQGTLGVVTWAAVICERLPSKELSFFVGADSITPLMQLSAALSHSRIGSALFIANRNELACLIGVTSNQIDDVAARFPAWALCLRLSVGDEMPDEEIALLVRDMNATVKSFGLDAVEEMHGCGAEEAFHSVAHECSHRDRLLGASKELFFLTTGDKVGAFMECLRASGWPDAAVYVQPRLQGRNVHVEISLLHTADAGDERRAAAALAYLSRACHEAGAFFSRPYGPWATLAYARNKSIIPYLRKTKNLLDPRGVLNPGRLCY